MSCEGSVARRVAQRGSIMPKILLNPETGRLELSLQKRKESPEREPEKSLQSEEAGLFEPVEAAKQRKAQELAAD